MLGVSRRTKVRHHAALAKYRGSFARDGTSTTAYAAPKEVQEQRSILADVVHKGDAAEFYLEKNWFYKKAGRGGQLMPTWDRVAQALIALSRPAPRVVPEAAFRLFAVFMKMMLLNRIADMAAGMAPLWLAANAQNHIGEGLRKRDEETAAAGGGAPKTEGGADAPPSTS